MIDVGCGSMGCSWALLACPFRICDPGVSTFILTRRRLFRTRYVSWPRARKNIVTALDHVLNESGAKHCTYCLRSANPTNGVIPSIERLNANNERGLGKALLIHR